MSARWEDSAVVLELGLVDGEMLAVAERLVLVQLERVGFALESDFARAVMSEAVWEIRALARTEQLVYWEQLGSEKAKQLESACLELLA